ncbi:hypothetical protein Moror_3461 [Moniliophthora roreri MCA 2997]|uniref:Uncharacterized protein n=1 Tax=Moniliophthora roreri (strain MCA 2997) TaxID=1381753 RepID=V2WJ34_MONRO|nr:hypothetical protein Moror_3461 [Moniliophthora roreri MCA 2997]
MKRSTRNHQKTLTLTRSTELTCFFSCEDQEYNSAGYGKGDARLVDQDCALLLRGKLSYEFIFKGDTS